VEGERAARGLHGGLDAGHGEARRPGAELVLPAGAVAPRGPAGAELVGQSGAPRIAGVHHGDAVEGQVLDEEPALGGEVPLHVAVVVEVVTGEVGEAGGGEAQPGHPLLRQRVRGDLHHHQGGAGVAHLAEQRLHGGGLGRGVGGGALDAGEPVRDGPHHAGGKAGGARAGLDQVAHRGLAVGAGHAEELHGVPGSAVEVGGGQRHGPPRRRRQQELRRCALHRSLGDDRDGAAASRLGGEGVAIRAGARERAEERPRNHFA
jgi:hypothetical protein